VQIERRQDRRHRLMTDGIGRIESYF